MIHLTERQYTSAQHHYGSSGSAVWVPKKNEMN